MTALRRIVLVYLHPLRELQILSNAQIKDLFINIEVLLKVNDTLLSDLQKGDPDPYKDIGTIFMKIVTSSFSN